MILGYRKAPLDSKRFPKLAHQVVGAQFRKRFVLFAAITATGTLALFFIPLCLFLFQNYSSFKTLAYDIHPQILNNLEQETMWLLIFAGVSFIALVSFTSLWTYQMTKELSYPLEKVQQHMARIIQGDLSAPLEINEKELMKDYLKGYEALVHFLNVEHRIELEYLRRLNIDPQFRDAHRAWKTLIEMKEHRLGMTIPHELHLISNGALSDEVDSERRAS